MQKQLGISSNMVVDWTMFCRETCEVVMMNAEQLQIGGEGKIVQTDESKIGKRKYYKGHKVEGQWVFGGIEQESGKFLSLSKTRRSYFATNNYKVNCTGNNYHFGLVERLRKSFKTWIFPQNWIIRRSL
ncbi:hypothetical protein HOLleu_43696 [Holothuria leucospilota]|uniref:Transposase n=1 Tax=Holothuria leucospilota TaxID=206669 RepID=A0A9Q0Y9C9_HOLLE|nr:hypothetical protein HOLleu_43696 [Holothuria leucospilota]